MSFCLLEPEMRLHTHSDCPWSFEFPVSEAPSLQRRDASGGWAFLRLRLGLHKARVTDGCSASEECSPRSHLEVEGVSVELRLQELCFAKRSHPS